MDCADDSWTVVSERKIDGSCKCPEEQDEEAMSQPDKVDKWIRIQPNNKMLCRIKAHSVSCIGSGRQVSALLTSNSDLTYQSGSLSVGDTSDVQAPHSMSSDTQENASYVHSMGPRLENPSPRMLQGSSVPSTASIASTASRPDQSSCIPRTADSIPTLLRNPRLFPHLQDDKIEEWVQICEKYRDRACSGQVIGHLEPLSPEEFEELSHFQYTPAMDNQQDTPCVEDRQNKGLPHDTDSVEDKPKAE